MIDMNLLVASGNAKFCQELAGYWTDFQVLCADSAEEAELTLLEQNPGVVIYDLEPRGTLTLEALKVIRRIRPHIPVIVLADEFCAANAGSKVLELGVFYLQPKPASRETLEALVESALQKTSQKSI